MAGHATGLRGRFDRWRQGLSVRPDLRADDLTSAGVVPGHLSPEESRQPLRTAPFAGRMALVADDNEINRMILRTFLERLGFAVTLASDGCEAVSNWKPAHDLLCLDIQMPGQDGIAALAEIRGLVTARGDAMPLALAVTVNSMSHQVAQYLSSGFDACLPKPFDRSELESMLRRRWPDNRG